MLGRPDLAGCVFWEHWALAIEAAEAEANAEKRRNDELRRRSMRMPPW
jgi:hypothetical protein